MFDQTSVMAGPASKKTRQIAEQYNAARATCARTSNGINDAAATGTTGELLGAGAPSYADVSATDRLPDEILAEIFALRAKDCRKHGPISARFQWLAVTEVSRRWRGIALGQATLWASAVMLCNNVRWLRKWLRRSKAAPLEVFIHDYENSVLSLSPRILRALESSASHIKSLQLILTMALVESVEDSPILEVPILDTLHLRSQMDAHDEPESFWILSGAPMASLKELVLERIPSTLYRSFLRPTLTRLSIKFGAMSVVDCIETLAYLPSLEMIALIDCFSTMDVPPPPHRIQMPCLGRLYIGLGYEDNVTGAIFLNHLSLPSACCIHLQVPNGNDCVDLFAAVQAKLSRTHLETCTFLFSGDWLVVDLWPDSTGFDKWPIGFRSEEHEDLRSITADTTHPQLHLDLAFPPRQTPQALADSLPSYLDFLPSDLSTVETLRLIAHDVHEAYDMCLRTILDTFSHIHILDCDHSDVDDILRYLAQPAAPNLPLPNLLRLVLREVYWHPHGIEDVPLYMGVRTPAAAIEAMLAARRQMEIPLKSLIIDRPRNFYEEDMKWFDDMSLRVDVTDPVEIECRLETSAVFVP